MKSLLPSLWLLSLFLSPAVTNAFRDNMPNTSVTPVCSAEEELFQLQFSTSENLFPTRSSFRIVTADNDETHAECTICEYLSPGVSIELCLPRDECHTALVGRDLGRSIACILSDSTPDHELVARWGDKTLRRNNAFLIDRINFGDGCLVETVCDASTESLFEFFLVRDTVTRRYPDPFSWTLTEFAMGEPNKTYLEGQAPYNEESFIYKTACVPRDSCLQFYMGYPSDLIDVTPYYDDSKYSIRLDGVIYAEGALEMSSYTDEKKSNHTTNLGVCTVEKLCNATAEDLFEMEFTVSSTAGDKYCDNDEYHNSTSALPSSYLPFLLRKENLRGAIYDNYYHIWSADYGGFNVNQTYASMSCIPNDECALFSWQTDNPVTGYKIFQNGEELVNREVHSEYGPNQGLTTTKAGVCAGTDGGRVSSALSSIPEGVVASTSLTVLTFLLMYL